jgi:hypothetical protein
MHIIFLDGSEQSSSYTLDTPLLAHEVTKYNVSLDKPVTFPPVKVIIAPVTSVSKSYVDVCDDNRIELENIEECS